MSVLACWCTVPSVVYFTVQGVGVCLDLNLYVLCKVYLCVCYYCTCDYNGRVQIMNDFLSF